METIQAAPNGMNDGGVPSGCILMWSGSTATIPNGWHLCDGSNRTPDLRNRFIVGAGSGYSPGNTGGTDTVTLTTDQMPSHCHSVQDSGHSHSVKEIYYGAIMNIHQTGGEFYAFISTDFKDYITTTSYANISCSYAGSGNAHENRPPITHCALS